MKQESGTSARKRLAMFAGVCAAAAAAQAALAAPPVLESKNGLLVLPNVKLETAAKPVDGQQAPVRGGAAAKAYKDHETGQLRKATPEEQQAEAAAPASNDASGARVVQRDGARKSAILDDSFLSHSVVRRGADGALEMDCVTGETAAQHALHAKPVAKEQRHAK